VSGLRTLVELTAYDIGGASAVSLYLTDGTAYITAPGDTPASQAFAPLLTEAFTMRRRLQGVGGGRVQPSYGDLRVANGDGLLDAWAGYAFDGRPLTVTVGPVDGAYATDFTTIFTGTIDRVDIQRSEVVIRLRDPLAALQVPLQATLYAGDNVPPDGLEGGEDLEGTPKPLVFGRVRNVPLVPVNTAKLIYQVADHAIESVDAAYDSGIRLGKPSTWEAGGDDGDFVSADLSGGAWDGTRYYLVNTSGEIYTSTTAADGSWTQVDDLAVGLTAIEYGDDGSDTVVTVGNSGAVWYSQDGGATWTENSTGSGSTLRTAHYSTRLGLWIVAGDSGVMFTAPDITGSWTSRTSSFSTTRIEDIAENATTLVAVGYAGKVATSTNGTTDWAQGSSSVGANYTQDLHAVAFGATRFRACGDDGLIISTGDLGATWEREPSTLDGLAGGTAYDLTAIAFDGDDGWLVGGTTRQIAFASGDDPTWTRAAFAYDPLPALMALSGILLYGTRWVAAGGQRAARAVTGSEAASIADLEDDTLAPTPGDYHWVSHADGSYIRLGSAPAGAITADITQGATSADRTAGQLFADVLTLAGYSSGDWSASDVTALDTAEGGEQGLVVAEGEDVADVLDTLARSVGAWWGAAADGTFRIQQLAAPSGSSTFDVTEYDVLDIERVASSDPVLGLPSYRTTLRYWKNHLVQGDGLAGGVPASRRADVGRAWREVVDTDTAVQTPHLLAQATVEDSCFTTQADAQGECDRRQALRGTLRHAYLVTVPLEPFAAVDVGAVGTLTHPRFGLSGGELVRCLGVEPSARDRTVTLLLWY
jgi:hypothetical protein